MVDYGMIGAYAKKFRLKKRLTQEQLSEVIGVGTIHISHIETGNTLPRSALLMSCRAARW